MRKSLCSKIFLLLLAAIFLIQPTALASVRLQDDFYSAVNAHWLARTNLADDRPSISGFCELSGMVLHQLRVDFDAMDKADGALGQFLAYYAMASDYTTRDIHGAAPLLPYIQRLQSLENLAQLDAELGQWVLDCMVLPFSLHVNPDMAKASEHALYASAPGLFLPEVSYYGTPVGQALLSVLAETGHTLLTMAGVLDAEQIVADAIAFDAMLLPYAKSAEALGAYPDLYYPASLETFASYGGALDLGGLLEQLFSVPPKQVVLMNPAYFEAFAELIAEEHFPMLRNWMLFHTVFNLSGYLDQRFQSVASAYKLALTGQTKPQDPAELAFLLAIGVYGGVVGDYYGRTYFGEDARHAVTVMAERLIGVFRERLAQNDWLSPETIAAAIAKLDTLTVNIGYPDTIDPIYNRLVVTGTQDGGTLLSNTMAFARTLRAENFARYHEPVDRSRWGITAHTVNAQYNPMANAITFPAAILQPPFYSPDQSESANYGGIGAVIAHEITHAFDTNGAQFDADGSLNNWWTEADYAAFEEKIQSMIGLFDGVPVDGGSVNGRMTATENTADAGGLASALQIVETLPDADLAAFFRNWAVIWRNQTRPEYAKLLLALDVHAPGKLRANMQLGNLDAFYDTFDITENDGMYIPPGQRVTIW